MAVDKQKVIDLLAASISPGTIAQTLCCDPSYISQLAADPEVLDKVVALRVAKATKVAETDDKVQDIRSTLINQMAKIAGFTTKMSDICMALGTIDKMASRLPSANIRPDAGAKTAVTIVLPKELAINYTMNTQNQIVEVNDRAVETMSANRVLEHLQQRLPEQAQLESSRPAEKDAARQLTVADL